MASWTQHTPTPPLAPKDQNLLAGLDLADGVHHANRGAIGDRQRGRLLKADAFRNLDELMRLGAAEFGEAAVLGLAHQAAFDAVDRIDQHAITDVPAGDAGAKFGDLTDHVEANDDRQRHLDAGHTAAGENVVIVDRRCPHADDNVALAGLRRRIIRRELQLIVIAVFVRGQLLA